jgi:polar amino acid transport system substrate-binding protein
MKVSRRAQPYRLLSAALLAFVCAGAAAGTLGRAQQRGRLLAGLAQVPAPYAVGAKFRTPDAIDAALAEDFAGRLSLPLETVRTERRARLQALASGQVDLLLVSAAGDDPLHPAALIVPTGYATGPMAIMRNDTDIRSWQQLKGRTVCVARDGRYVGSLAARYGAIEKPMRGAADSLLALRIGSCDAAVHDNTLLEELIKLPEWKKFSAKLTSDERTPLVFALPVGDTAAAAAVRQAASRWQAGDYFRKLQQKRARTIAFEVYLDQDVPDCH